VHVVHDARGGDDDVVVLLVLVLVFFLFVVVERSWRTVVRSSVPFGLRRRRCLRLALRLLVSV